MMRAALPTDLLLRLMNATPEQYAAIELILGLRAAAVGVARKERKRAAVKTEAGDSSAAADMIHRVGRLAYRNGFADVWLGEEHFDLSRRAKARACLRFLVEQRAFEADSARDLITEIDPYVRAQCRLPELPGYGELKIHHYFNPSKSDVARLGRELIRPAGRNGRYYIAIS